MEWEDTKENFVPVKHGHSAAALSTPLSVTKGNRELEDVKRTFLEDIKTADDPLAAWQRYIKWTQEQFAAQGGKSELQQVLETATKSLSSTNRYNNDVRLLRIWVQYADCLPDPSDVFLYLENKSIGRDHALLYEAYATYLELKGNFQQADLVYQEGINRLAKPLERLKQKHAAFKQRMEKRIQRQTSEALLGMESAAAAADTSRDRATLAPVLAPLGRPQLDENGNHIRPNQQLLNQQRHSRPPTQTGATAAGIRPAVGSSSTRPSLFSSSSSGGIAPPAAGGLFSMGSSHSAAAPGMPLAPVAPAAAAAAAANGAKLFDVLVDEEFGPSGSGVRPIAFPAGHNPHSLLPGYKLGRKENTTEAGEWAGQKLKQQAVYTAPTLNRLEVYEDDDFAEPEEAAEQQQQQQQQQSTLRRQLEAPGIEVKQNIQHVTAPQQGVGSTLPFSAVRPGVRQQSQAAAASVSAANKPASSSSSSSSKSSSKSTAGSTAAAAAAGANAPQGYNAALLVRADGSELSFEENRAAAWRAKRAKKLQQQEEQRKRIKQQQAEEQKQQQRRELQQQEEQRQRLQEQQAQERQRQQAQQKQQEAEKANAAAAAAAAAEQRAKEAAAAAKAAAAAEASKAKEAAAAAALHQEQQQRQQQQQQQAALFSQQQQQQQQQQPSVAPSAAAAAAAAAAEPTVTINTRAALDSLNFMFSQDLPTMTLSRHAIASAAAMGQGHLAAAAASGYPAAAAAAGMRARKSLGGMAAEPTVTVNTRAALEAMNGMFGSGDDTMTMHEYGGSARVVPGFRQGPRGVGQEPTVTINTRQAFDCMNDMFGDMTGQQTMTGRQMMAGRTGTKSGNSRLSTAAAAAAGGWQLHEDTELLQNTRGLADSRCTGGLGSGGAGHSSWELREDTEFVGNNSSGSSSRPVGNELGMGLGLCEDTEFLTRPVEAAAAAAAAGTQYAVYEDTDYLDMPAVPAVSSGLNRLSLANRVTGTCQVSSGGSGVEAPGGLGLSVHEDTDLLTCTAANAANAKGGGVSRSNPFGIRSHAAAAAAAVDRSLRDHGTAPGGGLGLELHEDTELLTSHDAAAVRGLGRAGSSSTSIISRGHKAAEFSGSRDAENCPEPLIGLGLYEDTELLTRHTADAALAPAAGRVNVNRSVPQGLASRTEPEDGGLVLGSSGLRLHEDTDLLPMHEPTAAAAAAPGTVFTRAGSSSSNTSSRAHISEECSDTTTGLLRIKENLPAAAATAAAVPRAHRAPFGAAAAATGAGPHGSSRLGHSSAPGSPVGHHGTAWGTTTPGKPPLGALTPGRHPVSATATPTRGPRTPGTPWARPMDEFEVMESPAVREALAGRPAMQMSPAVSLPSPGLGSCENVPSGNDDAQIKPRSMRDRASRAAALQPLSDTRAELLGVHIDPTGEAAEGDEEDAASATVAEGSSAFRADGKPTALRSLKFHG